MYRDQYIALKKELDEIKRKLDQCIMPQNENVKIGIISTRGPQMGKWAVSYKYKYKGYRRAIMGYEDTEKWVPLFCCDTREEAVSTIPEVICALGEFYTQVGGE